MFHLARSVATSLFIALSVSVVVRTTGANYSSLGHSISDLNKILDLPGALGGWSLDTVAGLSSMAREINRQAAMVGYLNAFLLHTLASAAALPLVLLVSRRRAG